MKSRTAIRHSHPARLLLICTVCVLADESGSFADAPKRASEARAESTGPLRVFTPSEEKGSFNFETQRMQGTIRLDGPYHGVSRLVDRRTGLQVIDSRYSALNLFKLMSVNQCMGQPRSMERSTSFSDRWVEVKWRATGSHLAELTARYEVATPSAIDLTVTVESSASYRAYELFLSNYFDKRLRPHVYLWTRNQSERELVLPMVNAVFRGTVLVFPRDAHAARHCLDGRWERRENSTPTVQMCPVRPYAHCLGFLVDEDNKLAVMLMSKPADCYAISTRYHADNDADRLTTYSAFDMSLFGDDFLASQTRSVKVRLAVTELDSEWSQPLSLYEEYTAAPSAAQSAESNSQE